ncbi:MAG: hypothetical protein HKM93_00415 [Desulfobacteraceae bacterium]|nr:hypothetical protein [Desulfobacteraceae bacterium]
MKEKKTVKKSSAEIIELTIPLVLLDRVRSHCDRGGVELRDFVMDAIAEKLELAHRERRRKTRL